DQCDAGRLYGLITEQLMVRTEDMSTWVAITSRPDFDSWGRGIKEVLSLKIRLHGGEKDNTKDKKKGLEWREEGVEVWVEAGICAPVSTTENKRLFKIRGAASRTTVTLEELHRPTGQLGESVDNYEFLTQKTALYGGVVGKKS
ncbi:hypothetical protein CHARACLAT_008876, partial [Characodon lateralis]|nr:hypothetical protein [Characodon lateralis]